jgi:hypothetical protein
MTDLPSWTYTGVVPIGNDLSLLESALHTGRVSAAERGYTGEPEISTEEVMERGEADATTEPSYLSPEQAGQNFVATHLRYRMVWPAES